jgi:hypothetical protein
MALEEAVSVLDTNIPGSVQSALGTAADIWVIIALIIPGFVTFKIFASLAVYETRFDQFTSTIYSLVCSLVIFLPVAVLYNLRTFNEIRTNVGYPEFVFSLLVFAVIFGVIPGLIMRKAKRGKYTFDGPWETFGQKFLGEYVVVFTTDDRKFRGWITRVSQGEKKKEISLADPELIKINRDNSSVTYPMGKELLFNESDIRRVLAYQPKDQEQKPKRLRDRLFRVLFRLS